MSLTFARDKRLPEILERLDRAWPAPPRADAGTNAEPLAQLVFMVIATGTPSSLSLAVFSRLRARFRNWALLRDAEPEMILPVLRGVERAGDKATTLPRLLQAVEARAGALDLSLLADYTGEEAMSWLTALPGVGPTIAAATLSFSTLRKTVVTVDADTARPIRRLALAPEGAPISALDRHVMDRIPAEWKGGELARLHRGLSRLAAGTCHRGKPDCRHCPLNDLCPTARRRSATILQFPKKASV